MRFMCPRRREDLLTLVACLLSRGSGCGLFFFLVANLLEFEN